MLNAIIVMLKRTCIVRRVNEDAFYLAGELLFERFEGEKIVAENEAVVEKVVIRHALSRRDKTYQDLRAGYAARVSAGCPSRSKSVRVSVCSPLLLPLNTCVS